MTRDFPLKGSLIFIVDGGNRREVGLIPAPGRLVNGVMTWSHQYDDGSFVTVREVADGRVEIDAPGRTIDEANTRVTADRTIVALIKE